MAITFTQRPDYGDVIAVIDFDPERYEELFAKIVQRVNATATSLPMMADGDYDPDDHSFAYADFNGYSAGVDAETMRLRIIPVLHYDLWKETGPDLVWPDFIDPHHYDGSEDGIDLELVWPDFIIPLRDFKEFIIQ